MSAKRPSLMSRLTGNLLENAFKYGGGLVRVSLHREHERAILSVSDNGEGIPPAELEKIWNRFYRLEKSRSGGGLGLGLALVRQIADIHGARVTAESGADGTVFTLLLPVKSQGSEPFKV